MRAECAQNAGCPDDTAQAEQADHARGRLHSPCGACREWRFAWVYAELRGAAAGRGPAHFPVGVSGPCTARKLGFTPFLGGKIEKIGPHKAGATQLIVDAQGDKPAANAPAVRGAGLSKPATRERFFRGRRVGPAVFWPSPALVITPCTVDPRYGADLPVRDWVACSGRT
jgi:hypothetical protein